MDLFGITGMNTIAVVVRSTKQYFSNSLLINRVFPISVGLSSLYAIN